MYQYSKEPFYFYKITWLIDYSELTKTGKNNDFAKYYWVYHQIRQAGVNVINILCTNFSYKSALRSFSFSYVLAL